MLWCQYNIIHPVVCVGQRGKRREEERRGEGRDEWRGGRVEGESWEHEEEGVKDGEGRRGE